MAHPKRNSLITNIQSQKATAREVLVALGRGERVAVVGSTNADLTAETEQLPCSGETVIDGPLETLPGGKSINQAVTCALLGTATSFIEALGDDTHDNLLYQSLHRAGVDAAGVNRVNQPSGSTLTTVGSHGENTIVYSVGANTTFSAASVAVRTEIIRGAQVLGLCPEPPLGAVAAAVAVTRKAGMTVALSFPSITEAPDSLLRLVNMLIVNEHELAALAGHPLDPDDTAGLQTALGDLDFEHAVLTLGADSALVLEGGEFVSIPPFVIMAVDTAGCGDVFMRFLLAAIAAGELPSRGAYLASAAAGVTALRKGAQASYRNAREVRESPDFS